MRSIVLKRLATAIPSLVGVIIVSFLLTRVLPGDTASYFAGPAATPQAIAEVRKQLGLDKSLPEQFARYVADLAHGNLGTSLTTGQPVVTEITNRLPASGELTLLGLLIALSIAVPLGILAAVREGSWIDHLCRIIVTTGVSLPVFFTGLLLVYIFYFQLGWSPRYDFRFALERLKAGEDPRSELARAVGAKGYHAVTTGPYTVR